MIPKSQLKISAILYVVFELLSFLIGLGAAIYQAIDSLTGYMGTISLGISTTCQPAYVLNKYTDFFVTKIISVSFAAITLTCLLSLVAVIIALILLVTLIRKSPNQIEAPASKKQQNDQFDFLVTDILTPSKTYLLYIITSFSLLSAAVYVGLFIALVIQCGPCINLSVTWMKLYIFMGLGAGCFIIKLFAFVVILFWSCKLNNARQQFDQKSEDEQILELKKKQKEQLEMQRLKNIDTQENDDNHRALLNKIRRQKIIQQSKPMNDPNREKGIDLKYQQNTIYDPNPNQPTASRRQINGKKPQNMVVTPIGATLENLNGNSTLNQPRNINQSLITKNLNYQKNSSLHTNPNVQQSSYQNKVNNSGNLSQNYKNNIHLSEQQANVVKLLVAEEMIPKGTISGQRNQKTVVLNKYGQNPNQSTIYNSQTYNKQNIKNAQYRNDYGKGILGINGTHFPQKNNMENGQVNNMNNLPNSGNAGNNMENGSEKYLHNVIKGQTRDQNIDNFVNIEKEPNRRTYNLGNIQKAQRVDERIQDTMANYVYSSQSAPFSSKIPVSNQNDANISSNQPIYINNKPIYSNNGQQKQYGTDYGVKNQNQSLHLPIERVIKPENQKLINQFVPNQSETSDNFFQRPSQNGELQRKSSSSKVKIPQLQMSKLPKKNIQQTDHRNNVSSQNSRSMAQTPKLGAFQNERNPRNVLPQNQMTNSQMGYNHYQGSIKNQPIQFTKPQQLNKLQSQINSFPSPNSNNHTGQLIKQSEVNNNQNPISFNRNAEYDQRYATNRVRDNQFSKMPGISRNQKDQNIFDPSSYKPRQQKFLNYIQNQSSPRKSHFEYPEPGQLQQKRKNSLVNELYDNGSQYINVPSSPIKKIVAPMANQSKYFQSSQSRNQQQGSPVQKFVQQKILNFPEKSQRNTLNKSIEEVRRKNLMKRQDEDPGKLYFYKKKNQNNSPSRLKLYQQEQLYLQENSYRSILPQGGLQQAESKPIIVQPLIQNTNADSQYKLKNGTSAVKRPSKRKDAALIQLIRSKYS